VKYNPERTHFLISTNRIYC